MTFKWIEMEDGADKNSPATKGDLEDAVNGVLWAQFICFISLLITILPIAAILAIKGN
jgi:hypothetical protein